MQISKEEVLNLVSSHPHVYIKETSFKKNFTKLYQEMNDWKFPNDFNLPQKLYHFLHNDHELKLGTCPTCGKRCKYISFNKGYSLHCSSKCNLLDGSTFIKQRETMYKKYNSYHYCQSNEFKEKIKSKHNSKIIIYSKEEAFEIITSQPNGNIELKCFKKKFPELYKEILSLSFPENFKWTQKLYHYFNNDYELKLGICPACDKRCKFKTFNIGYTKYCSITCNTSSLMKTQQIKEIWKNKSQEEINEHFRKNKEIKLLKYDNPNYNNIEQGLKTKEERYGDRNFNNRPQAIKTCQEKYHANSWFETDEFKSSNWLDKVYETKRKNNSWNISKIEKDFEQYLKENNINYIYQYKSDLYPFNCDFFISDYDLYIEIQGYWSHGKHPFDKNNTEDIELLNKWKSKNTKLYNQSIYVWTELDVKKRNIAKENKINYLEIFSYNIKEVIEIFENYIKEKDEII